MSSFWISRADYCNFIVSALSFTEWGTLGTLFELLTGSGGNDLGQHPRIGLSRDSYYIDIIARDSLYTEGLESRGESNIYCFEQTASEYYEFVVDIR